MMEHPQTRQPIDADRAGPSAAYDPRVPLAAERTLLAWIRTGIALMGFGFVVARFGVFLQEAGTVQDASTPRMTLSIWVGTGMVLLGVAINLVSACQYRRLIARLERGEIAHRPGSRLGVAVAVILGLLGVLMAAYLAAMAW